jgi:shikimate dehydrogenase
MKEIDPFTKLYGVIGHPLAHTFSPRLQNPLFEKYGLNAVYLAFPREPKNFAALVQGLKGMSISGFNITLPYKTRIMPFCQIIDPEARRIGAVNTVVVVKGKWKGYNTDNYGFYEALRFSFKKFSLEGSKVLILGAGGSAFATAWACLMGGCASLTIANRTKSKSVALRDRLLLMNFNRIHDIELTHDLLEKSNDFDLIINCTAYGLQKEMKPLIYLEHARPGTRIFDLIYNPSLTSLLKEAKKYDLPSANGLAMLVFQGHKAFELWTGKKPPFMYSYKRLLAQTK